VKALFAEHLGEYSQAYAKVRERAGLRTVDGAAHTAHLGRPDGTSCRDYHRQCHEWADKVGIPAGLACAQNASIPLRLTHCMHLRRVSVKSTHSTWLVTRTSTC
jgi:hypothetical protein